MTQKESMLAGEYYLASDPELTGERLRARRLLERYNASACDQADLRTRLLMELLGSTGDVLKIEPRFWCDYGYNIHVGENFYMNYDCVLLDVMPIRFGDDCMLGPQVGIYTATHPVDPVERTRGWELGKPVSVGHRCWIGGHSVLNPGVTLGDEVVVASGSVVTKSFPSRVVIGGNPAKIIREV